MLHTADMDPNLLGAVDDSIDPNIFNIFDVGNSAVSPNLEDGFTWADDLISSAELDPSNSGSETPSGNQVSVQSAAGRVQQVATATHQQLLQGSVIQQQMTGSVGGVQLMAGGQQQGMVAASSAGSGQTQQVLQNQAIIQGNISSQQIGSPFILKTNASGAPSSIQVANASNSIITAAPHQFLPSSSTLVSRAITPSQSPSPHLSRSLTPSQTLSTSISRPQGQLQQVAVTAAGPSNINLLQINQSQISQQVPLQSFVTNQTAQQNNLLQGHAVLASHGSNIVHTQNALIQNPNVVNVNVAHVLPNQLNLQGTLIQTPQGKFLIQSPAGGQQLPGQLNLGALSNLGQVQMTGGVGLGQTTVMAQPPSSVIGSSGVTQQQQQQSNFSLVNLGGPQGQQILIQRSATAHGVQATPNAPVGQTNLILRTVAPNQQLLQQQQQMHATASTGQTVNMATAQVNQQLVTQTGTTQNLQLQQLITAGGGQSLRLVGQPSVTPHQSQGQTTLGGNVLLQPVVGGNQQVRLIGQQQQQTQAGSKPGTVTLNLAGQNLNLQQLQSLGGISGMQGIQLATSQQQPQFVIQQQQQQQQVQVASSTSTVMKTNVVNTLQNSVQTVTQQAVNTSSSGGSSSKKSKSKSTTGTSTNSTSSLIADNILSQALTASGIEPEDMMDLFNGGTSTDDSISATLPQSQPTPPPQPQPTASKSKKKKKKKEPAKDLEPVQPVVLSSTKDITGVKTGLSTASSTAVTTTISQAAIALPGQASQASSVGGTHFTISGQNIITSTTTASTLPTIGMPAVAMNSQLPVVGATTGTSTLATSTVQTTPARGGKHGPPNVSVKPMVPHLQLTLSEKQQLLSIQTELQRLQNKTNRTEADLALVQQLEMQRRKILAQAQSQAILNQQKQQQAQQQVTLTSNMVGQPLVAQPQTTVAQLQQRQQSQSQLKLEVKPLMSQTQPAAPTNSMVQIQTKPSTTLPTKLKLVSPKLEPGVQTNVAQDSKPVLVASSGTAVTQATVGGVTSTQTSQATLPTATGNVVMAMSSTHGVGQAANKNVILPTQQNVVRLQFAQKTQSVTMAAVTVASTTPQQVIVPSPQKVTVVANGSGGTVMSAGAASSAAVPRVVPVTSLSPSQARPVQIKIANQILTLQLTPPQQEKLELHLSRMTLEQQQAFLRTQQPVLAKLQLRTETVPTQPSQAAAGLGVSGASGSTAAVVAPTVVAAVSAGGDASQKVVITAPNTVTIATQQQQLPVTVQQALESSQNKADSSQSAQSAGVKRVHVPEIPKASMIHQQLSKDQANALAPDTKNPFKDYREACRRLLRYHTFQSPGPPLEAFEEADRDFESMSEDLVEQKDAMLAKYRLLLMEESMRGYPTAEMVYILRMLSQDMHATLREDKQLVEKNPDAFVPMPAQYLEQKIPRDDDSSDESAAEEEERVEEEEPDDGDDDVDDEEGDKDVRAESVEEGGEEDNNEDDHDDDELGEQPSHEESRNEEEEMDSVSESINDQLESVNTSYENTSYEDSFETPSSPPKDESVTKSESLHSSPSPIIAPPPPPSDAPVRGIFKLVIRNDGKGFTSRLASERRKSLSKGKHRKERHRSGEEVSEEDSRCKTSASNSPAGGDHRDVSDVSSNEEREVEYVDIDQYSRNVSVKLERLSDSVSQVYGVGGTSPNAGSSGGGSSRKRKKGEIEAEGGRHKRDRHSPASSDGSKVKNSGNKREQVHRTCDGDVPPSHSRSAYEKECASSRPAYEKECASSRPAHERVHSSSRSAYEKEHSTSRLAREKEHFSSRSAHEKEHSSSRSADEQEPSSSRSAHEKEHFSSRSAHDKERGDKGQSKKRGSGSSHVDSSAKCKKRMAQGSSSSSSRHNHDKHVKKDSSRSVEHPESSKTETTSEMQSAIDSIMELEDEQFMRRQQQDFSSHDVSLDEFVPESPLQEEGVMHPPAFTGEIPADLIQTEKMFNLSSSDNEMEASFENDADPQRTMMNPEMQHAIESILNGSGGSVEDGGGQHAKTYRSSDYSPVPEDDNADDECDNESGDESLLERTAGETSAVNTSDSQEMVVDDDLDAAVQSILM